MKNVNKTGAVFSLDKLNWLNTEYLNNTDIKELTDVIQGYLVTKNFFPFEVDRKYLEKVVGLFNGRISKLADLIDWAKFCFQDDFTYSQDTKDILKKNLSEEVKALLAKLNSIKDFNHIEIEREFRAVIEDLGLKMRDLVHPTRVALTGRKVGPGLFETMEVLGKDRVSQRLSKLIGYWKQGGPNA